MLFVTGRRVERASPAEAAARVRGHSSVSALVRHWGISIEAQIASEMELLYKTGFGRLSVLPLNVY